MAGQTSDNNQFNPFLSSTQQDLLLAALTSNNPERTAGGFTSPTALLKHSSSHLEHQAQADNAGVMFASPQQIAPVSGKLSSFDYDDTPYLDYLDGDASFDFDTSELGGQQLIGSLPGEPTSETEPRDVEKHDKRKSPEEGNDEEDGDPKRREGEDKAAKKPGRKPLTSEPTTKRKAQNRAAQRAFRERKEKHLKDLETKVSEMTKASEADKHENGLLRAQVERLQTELKEYRKRLSMASSGLGRSPPPSSNGYGNGSQASNNFQFEFPKFGGLSGAAPIFGNRTSSDGTMLRQEIGARSSSTGVLSHPSLSRENSTNRSFSPKGQNGAAGQSPVSPVSNNQSASRAGSVNGSANLVNNANLNSLQNNLQTQNSSNSFAGLFSPSLLRNGGADYGFTNAVSAPAQDNGTDTNSGLSRVFRFNSGSTASNTDSPSASSLSQWNPNSSCGTSPEPSHPSPPVNMDNKANAYMTFPQQTAQAAAQNPVGDINNLDWLTSQNGGQFDPQLFGEYRESQDAIVGNGDFDNGLFNEAFNDAFPYDLGSPFNTFGDLTSSPKQQTQALASRSLMAEVEKQRDGNEDDGLGPVQQIQRVTTPGKMLNCNTIWNQLQSNQDFQDGKFDLDGLCSELRAKAKCSESGVMVGEEHVDAALKKLGQTGKSDNNHLVFEQDHFDAAVKKLGKGAYPLLGRGY